MSAASKFMLVAAGYAAALLVAFLAVGARMALIGGDDAQASAGMSAFGDALLFVAIFGVFALIPTGALLFLLKSALIRKRNAHER